jgi:hypothetical protein
MKTITYLQEVPIFKKIFGIAVGFFGITALASGNLLYGLIAVVIGINLVATEGSEIHLEYNTYRKVKSVLGLKFGIWKPCPKFEYISVFRTKETQRVNVVTATTAFTNEIIELNLFYDGNKNINFYKTDDKTDAFKVAEQIKQALNIDILDATESEKKWL